MIKNYTSEVSADRSISYIERKLVECGASDIMKKYSVSRTLTAVCFLLPHKGGSIPIKLPARVERVEAVLTRAMKRPNPERVRAQAERTAWKLLAEWVAIQASLIELDQAEILEVFLPYIYDPAKEQTLFERAKAGNFKMLGAGV